MRHRGLNQSRVDKDKSTRACVVCLSEFEEKDVLRRLPNWSHTFHLDCIDVWLQGNANWPLCRTSISASTKYPLESNIFAPTSSLQDSQPYSGSFVGEDADFVVIELGGPRDEVLVPSGFQESESSRQVQEQLRTRLSVKVMEQRPGKLKSPKKHRHFSIMGDEFIDLRERDYQFGIQPVRRSFSFDSAVDQQLYSGVQRAIQQNLHERETSLSEESSSRSQSQRSFFKFVQGRGSRRVVPSS
ncbi:hypothetical protein K2173_026316 [Erythroxylum novogranatense]|uniref:RING-type E3 ubiquitin transferase n=1 Tax=Erythroxylum novogranatense TaxID=1862640 RepID=A0AAV8SBT7_9ROSI|nr:hypothetical protein K2173_026316 [Erythroxylum novogranatense]